MAHAAGSVKSFVTLDVWKRGIEVTSAAGANAQPVAEFALAAILMSGKRAFELSRVLCRENSAIVPDDLFPSMGNNRKRVGIIGASRSAGV